MKGNRSITSGMAIAISADVIAIDKVMWGTQALNSK
jgi:hypothetical protein